MRFSFGPPIDNMRMGLSRLERMLGARAHSLKVHVNHPFANPWVHAFGRWGEYFVADSSTGKNYFATAATKW